MHTVKKNQFEEFELLSKLLKISFLCIVVSEMWFYDVTYLNKFKLNGYDLFCSSPLMATAAAFASM